MVVFRDVFFCHHVVYIVFRFLETQVRGPLNPQAIGPRRSSRNYENYVLKSFKFVSDEWECAEDFKDEHRRDNEGPSSTMAGNIDRADRPDRDQV
jgi:hypothetical protein